MFSTSDHKLKSIKYFLNVHTGAGLEQLRSLTDELDNREMSINRY